MGLTEFKQEFLHPKTPEYIHTRLFEKICLKDHIKGLSEEDVIVFITVLHQPSLKERASLAFLLFDIKSEGSKIPVSNLYRFGNQLLGLANEDIYRIFDKIGFNKDDLLDFEDFITIFEDNQGHQLFRWLYNLSTDPLNIIQGRFNDLPT